MSHLTRKFVAVLLLLWLPVFTGNALAVAMVMQMPAGHCHEESMQMTDMGMGDMDRGTHPISGSANEHNTCGVCHLACTGYLAVPSVEIAAVQTAAREAIPYLVDAHSFTSAPLVPPPLVSA